ncbi:ACT domain-containing protein [Prolixibacteraceae bacterium Z1-6]|uniref:aspartate kinase n=1 Tax=Draconibacterium aestuarii TaxID=2998507 RepID=A0A9X3F7Z8_9BACT|nr:ACT domain-containing protein [Prolixibacteraceae bacterium Z1-6]
MSNTVIRLGGSHIGNAHSILNLEEYLKQKSGRKFVVVSAIKEILELINKQISTVFQDDLNDQEIALILSDIYSKRVVGEISKAYRELSQQLINLLKGIALIGDYSKALKDQVLSYAENLSVEILKAQWKSVSLLQIQKIELLATSDFGTATFLSVNHGKLQALPDGIYLVPGSFGITETGKLARTGRTSADYTAAFLTKELGAEKLELWDLDKDFQRADPAIINNPQKIKRLTYSEASELAYFDHYSFHPRTVEPLEHEHIPIEVISSDSQKGIVDTVINTETFIEEQIVKSVACTDDISLLKLDGPGVGLKPGILAKVTSQLNDSGINIKSVITSQTSINFILSNENGEKALKLVNKLGFSSVTEISLVNDISLIGVVGHGMQHAFGVSAKIFTAVANNNINVVLSGSGASDLVSYLVVNKSDKEKSVREIYKAFFE